MKSESSGNDIRLPSKKPPGQKKITGRAGNDKTRHLSKPNCIINDIIMSSPTPIGDPKINNTFPNLTDGNLLSKAPHYLQKGKHLSDNPIVTSGFKKVALAFDKV